MQYFVKRCLACARVALKTGAAFAQDPPAFQAGWNEIRAGLRSTDSLLPQADVDPARASTLAAVTKAEEFRAKSCG